MTMISRQAALRKYSIPVPVYRRGAGKDFATPRYGYADEAELVRYAHRWVARVARRIERGAALTKDEESYAKVKAALEMHAPSGELLTAQAAVEKAVGEAEADRTAITRALDDGRNDVDAQGLTDQDKLERMAKANFGDTETKAEALTKINKALMDSTLAQEKTERLLVNTGRLADVTQVRHVVGGYFRHVARGLETFRAQYTDRIAAETDLEKEDVRKLIDAALPYLLEIHKDGLDLLDGRIEEHRATAEAEADKRKAK